MAVPHGIRTLGILGSGICSYLSASSIADHLVGQMGLGIAYVAALRAKVPVLLSDKSQTQIKSGLALFDKLLAKDTDKGKITSVEAAEARDRLSVADDVKDMRDVDMVVEVGPICPPSKSTRLTIRPGFKAVSENLSLKSSIFRSLAAELRPDAILASNTSSISITKIASAVVPEGYSAASLEGKKSASRVVGASRPSHPSLALLINR